MRAPREGLSADAHAPEKTGALLGLVSSPDVVAHSFARHDRARTEMRRTGVWHRAQGRVQCGSPAARRRRPDCELIGRVASFHLCAQLIDAQVTQELGGRLRADALEQGFERGLNEASAYRRVAIEQDPRLRVGDERGVQDTIGKDATLCAQERGRQRLGIALVPPPTHIVGTQGLQQLDRVGTREVQHPPI